MKEVRLFLMASACLAPALAVGFGSFPDLEEYWRKQQIPNSMLVLIICFAALVIITICCAVIIPCCCCRRVTPGVVHLSALPPNYLQSA